MKSFKEFPARRDWIEEYNQIEAKYGPLTWQGCLNELTIQHAKLVIRVEELERKIEETKNG